MLAKVLRITWIPVLLAVLYTGWVFWQRRASQMPPRTAVQQFDPLLAYGDRLRILQFYGTPAIAQGTTGRLCYGVINAKSVRLDPPVERVWPSLSRCFDISPAATTRYTLTAESASGESASQSFEVKVR